MDWSNVVWNGLIWVGVIRINVNRVGTFVIPSYRMFAPNFSTSQLFSRSAFLILFLPPRFSLSPFFCAMPLQSPVGEIRIPYDRVKYVTDPLPGTGNMWAWNSDGSRWVYSIFFIRVPPKINTNFFTNFTTNKGEVLITMYPSINGRNHLVSMHNDIVYQTRTTYRNIFDPIVIADN